MENLPIKYNKPDKVPFFKLFIKNNFPFIEDTFEALDYYNLLCKVVEYLNNVIKNLNITEENIENLYSDFNSFREYVEEYLSQFDIDKINKAIDDKFAEIEAKDNLIHEEMRADIEKLRIEVNRLSLYIDERIVFILKYVDTQDEILKVYIDEMIAKLKKEIEKISLDNIDMLNPIFGKKDKIQNIINDLYHYLRYYGITCFDFDVRGITAEEFDNLNLTAFEFDLYSKCKILFDFVHKMFSPFTGKIEPLQNVINNLAKLHQIGITAEKFDSLELSTTEFDDKNISAYDFDWNGNNLLLQGI